MAENQHKPVRAEIDTMQPRSTHCGEEAAGAQRGFARAARKTPKQPGGGQSDGWQVDEIGNEIHVTATLRSGEEMARWRWNGNRLRALPVQNKRPDDPAATLTEACR